jgi:hypothetical protein
MLCLFLFSLSPGECGILFIVLSLNVSTFLKLGVPGVTSFQIAPRRRVSRSRGSPPSFLFVSLLMSDRRLVSRRRSKCVCFTLKLRDALIVKASIERLIDAATEASNFRLSPRNPCMARGFFFYQNNILDCIT